MSTLEDQRNGATVGPEGVSSKRGQPASQCPSPNMAFEMMTMK